MMGELAQHVISFYLSWAHTERQREEGSEMCHL